jgi:hypothetical protein
LIPPLRCCFFPSLAAPTTYYRISMTERTPRNGPGSPKSRRKSRGGRNLEIVHSSQLFAAEACRSPSIIVNTHFIAPSPQIVLYNASLFALCINLFEIIQSRTTFLMTS